MRLTTFSAFLTLLLTSNVFAKYIAGANFTKVHDLKLPIPAVKLPRYAAYKTNLYGCGDLPFQPQCSGSALIRRIPSIYDLPHVVADSILAVRSALAEHISSPLSQRSESPVEHEQGLVVVAGSNEDVHIAKARDTFGSMVRDRRQCCPWKLICVACGDGPTNGGSGLGVPRVFSLPIIMVKFISSIPTALADTVTTSLSLLPLSQAAEDNVEAKRNTFGSMVRDRRQCCPGKLICVAFGDCPTNATPSLPVPTLFRVPIILIKFISSIPMALGETLLSPFPSEVQGSEPTTEQGDDAIDVKRDQFGSMIRDRRQCCLGQLICVACGDGPTNAASSLRTLGSGPVMVINYFTSLPGSLATSTMKLRRSEIEANETEEPEELLAHMAEPQTIDGFTQFAGACTGSKHYCGESSGTNLSPPRIFAFPAIILKSLALIPKTLASAIPSNLTTEGEDGEENLRRMAEPQTIDGFTQFTGACASSKHYCGESAGANLPPPRIFAGPLMVMNFIACVPGTLAISTSGARDLMRRSDTKQEQSRSIAEEDDAEDFLQRSVPGGYIVSSTSAASSLQLPRSFTLPVILVNSIASIPRTFAAAIPSPNTATSEDDTEVTDEGVLLAARQASAFLIPGHWCHDRTGASYYCGASSSVRAPRIFALPAMLINGLVSIPKAIAAALPTASLQKRDSPFWVDSPFWNNWCRDLNGNRVACSAGSSLAAPRIFKLPTLLLGVVYQVRGAMAAAIPVVYTPSGTEVGNEVDGLAERDQVMDRGSRICMLSDYNQKTGKHYIYDCHTRSSSSCLSPPRLFKLPSLLLTTLYHANSTLAAALPSNILKSRQTIGGFTQFTGTCYGAKTYCGEKGAQPRLTPPYNSLCLVYNDDGSGHIAPCWRDLQKSSASDLSVPGLFRFPLVVLGSVWNAGKAMASAIPRPHEIIMSMAAPNFDLVRKSVSELRGMLSGTIVEGDGTKTQDVEIDGQRYKTFRRFDSDKGNNGWVVVLDNGTNGEAWKGRVEGWGIGVLAGAVGFAWFL